MLRLSRLRWTAVLAAVALAVFGTPAAMASVAPWFVLDSPSAGARAEVGEPVLITGYAYLGEGTPADGVELTFDEGATWTAGDIVSNGTWRYLFTPTQPGDVTFSMRGWYNGVLGDPSPPSTLHVGTPGSLARVYCPCTFKQYYNVPLNDIDTQPVELGVRFAVDRPGSVDRVVFQRGTGQSAVTIRVWGPGGTLLHEHVEPPKGRSVSTAISPPVQVQPGVDYVVSYYTPDGGYAASEDSYTGTLFHAPFIVRADAGVYRYGEGGGFPTDTWNHSDYAIYPYFVP